MNKQAIDLALKAFPPLRLCTASIESQMVVTDTETSDRKIIVLKEDEECYIEGAFESKGKIELAMAYDKYLFKISLESAQKTFYEMEEGRWENDVEVIYSHHKARLDKELFEIGEIGGEFS